nr:unnamed protein product [Spirometra erinaceieuropaei]
MRIHESGIDHISDTPTTTNTSTMPSPTFAPSPCSLITTTTTTTATSAAYIDTADITCPHCPRTFTSHIGQIRHLRIHRTETGEPVPGEPTYTNQTRLNCPHCPRTFRHRIGLFGHMRIHDDLRSLLVDTPTQSIPSSVCVCLFEVADWRAENQAETAPSWPMPPLPLTRTAPWRTVGTQSSRWPSSVAQTATYNLLSEKDRLHKAYIGYLTDEDDDRAASYRCRRLVQQRLHEMQVARAARKAKEIQGFGCILRVDACRCCFTGDGKFFFRCLSTKGQPVDALGAQIRQLALEAKERLRQEQAAKGQAAFTKTVPNGFTTAIDSPGIGASSRSPSIPPKSSHDAAGSEKREADEFNFSTRRPPTVTTPCRCRQDGKC